MTAATHPTMSPDVYAILLDIAKQPDSILLTVEPRQASREFLQPSDPIRSTAAFLTSAERHLLDAHREEVGRWALNETGRALARHPRLASRFHRHRVAREAYPTVMDVPQPWRPRFEVPVDRMWSIADLAAPRSDAERELERARRLLLLGSRLMKHPTSVSLSGHIDFAAGDHAAAQKRFERMTDWPGPHARVGNEWLGVIAAIRGDWHVAAASYEAAATCRWATPEPAFFWSLNAAQAGYGAAVAVALEVMSDAGGVTAEDTMYYTSVLRSTGWVPTNACREVLQRRALRGSVIDEVVSAL